MPTKKCPINRPVWGFVTQDKAPSVLGVGGPQITNINATSINADFHELRMEFESYMMYCIYCGEWDTQANWYTALQQDLPNQNHVKGG